MRSVRLVSVVAALAFVSCLSVGQAAADTLDVQSVIFLKNVIRDNGVVIPNGYQWTVQVTGTGITSATFISNSTPLSLTNVGSNLWEYSESYGSQAELDSSRPSSIATGLGLNINNYTEFDLLGMPYNATQPSAVPNITNPLAGAANVSLNPTYQWDSLTGIDALHLNVRNQADGSQPYLDLFDTNTSLTSWQPGSLLPSTGYGFDVTALNGTATARTFLGGIDPYTFYQVNGQSNSVDFSTGTGAVPEPMTLTLLGSGLVVLYRRRRNN